MSYWLKLYQDVHADTRLRKARARAIWPWVLCRIKDGDGEASDDMLDPWRASDDHDGVFSEADAAAMLERLKTAGMLVWTGAGWTTPNWRRHQADPTAGERKARQRERERSAGKAPAGPDGRDEGKAPSPPATAGLPTLPATSPHIADAAQRDTQSHGCHGDMRDTRDVTHVTAEQSREEQITSGAKAPPVAGAREAGPDGRDEGKAPSPPATAGLPTLPDLEALALDCIPAGKRRGMCLDPVSASKLVELTTEHGPAAVRAALLECGGSDRPVYMAASRLAKPSGRGTTAAGNGKRRQHAASTLWEAHGAPLPEPTSRPMSEA